MKIVCDGCRAHGEVPDNRVKGRTLKLRCRNCGKTLEVTGDADPQVRPSSPPEASASGEWYVRIEGQQFGPYNIVQIVGMLRAKELTWGAQVRRARSSEWTVAGDCQPLVRAAGARSERSALVAAGRSAPPPPPPRRDAAKLSDDTQPDLDVSELREVDTLEDEPLRGEPPDAAPSASETAEPSASETTELSASETAEPSASETAEPSASETASEARDESLWSHEESPAETAAGAAGAWPASREQLELPPPPSPTSAPAVRVAPLPALRTEVPRERVDSLVATERPVRAPRSGMALAVVIGSAMIASAIVFAVLRLRPEASAATAVAAVPSVAPEPTAAPPATTAPAAQPPSAAPADNPELLAAAAASPALKPEAALTPQQPTAAAPAAERTRKRKSAADEPAPPAPSAPSTTAEPQADSQDEPAEKPDPAPSPRAEPVAPSGSDFFSSAAPLSDTPSHAQVMRTMREVQPQVRACAQGHAASTATVAVTVLGATGRVSRVRISGVPEQVGNCIGHAVHAAKFPRFMRSEFAIDYAFRLGE